MCFLIVRVIVNAKDEEEALRKGKEALNEIAERTASGVCITYDSKELLDEWKVDPNNLLPVLLASSFKGRQLIEEGWQFMVDIFMDALERIKIAVQYLSPEEIMEEAPLTNPLEEIEPKISPSGIREDFREVGGAGENIFKLLYFNAYPVLSRKDLERTLNPREGLRAYVIPAAIPC